MRIVTAVVWLLAGPLHAAPPVAAEEPSPGFRLPADTRPLAYAIALDVDPRKDSYSGTETIRVHLDKARKDLWLHGLGLDVTSATVAGKKAAYQQTNDEGLARLALDAPVGPGDVDVVLAWKQKFNTRTDSIYKVVSDGLPYVFTQFESISGREGFPCFDEPGFKAPFTLTMTIHADDRVVANTAEASRKKLADGRSQVTFAPTLPLPVYLLAFAVGPFDIVEGRTLPANGFRKEPLPIRGVAVKGKGPALKDSLVVAAEALISLEKYFGLPYPYGKMDLVAVPDFAPGAMENAGLVTFRDAVLFADAKSPLGLQKYTVSTIAHEFSHQWFGDLVTLAWWDDIWLNEAFASFMQRPIGDDIRPSFQAKTERQTETNAIMGEDSLVSARQIRQPVGSKGDIVKAFDGITYLKGAAVIGMFEAWIGPEAFRKGVRDYLIAHANQTTTSADLFAALSAASGKDVATPFSTFLNQPGVPFVAAKLVCGKAAVLELTQSRFLPIGSTGDRNKLWQIPICVRTDKTAVCTMLTTATGSIALPSCPKLIHPNLDAGGYYRWSLPPAQLKVLSASLKVLTPGERLSFANALQASVSTASAPYAEVLEASLPLARDEEANVAGTPLGLLHFAHDQLVDAAARPKVKQKVIDTYRPLLDKLTLKPKPDEEPRVRELRNLALEAVYGLGEDQKTTAALVKLGRAVLGLDSDKKVHLDAAPGDLVADAVRAAVQEGGDVVFDDVAARLTTETDSLARDHLLGALSGVHDPARGARALDLALDPRLKVNELLRPLAEQSADVRTRDGAWVWTQKHFDALVVKLPAEWGQDAMPGFFGGYCSEEKAKELDAFFAPKKAKTPGLERGLAQLLESVRLCAARKAAHVESARKLFPK